MTSLLPCTTLLLLDVTHFRTFYAQEPPVERTSATRHFLLTGPDRNPSNIFRLVASTMASHTPHISSPSTYLTVVSRRARQRHSESCQPTLTSIESKGWCLP
ncbi:hypothetical protein EDB84DRAFT_332325 [Lactarius hengduanensis]|nr:hypothetical protein EDB84DRAFT_332325 [Lactarius hengduanensis]